MGRAELHTRVHAALLAAQPLAVEQMRASEFGAERCAAEVPDRVAVDVLRVARPATSARARASTPSTQSVPHARAISASRPSAPLAASSWPQRTAASTSSVSAQLDTCRSGACAAPSCAALSASS